MAGKKEKKIDGLNPSDIKKLRAAIRQVWSWSTPKRLCIARATGKDGFARCEGCRRKVPKVFADHIRVMGDVLAPDYLVRMFTPSKNLQALCSKCHNAKTAIERKDREREEIRRADFF